jgi:hypothetical protein
LLSWGRTAAPAAPEKPLATADVEREAQLATGASTDEAISVSQRCFAAAHDDDSLSSAKLCIVFDDAFLYWRQNADNYDAMPLYFREEITHMRHLDALGGSSDDADKTLGQLRDATFRALLAQLRRESQGSAAAPPVKGQGVKAGGTAESQNETAAEKNSSESVHI